MSDFYTKLGLRIRAVRMGSGLSQEQLATKLGVTFQMVQKYENGTCRLPLDKLVTLCAFCKVGLDDMAGTPTGNPEAVVNGLRNNMLGTELLPIITQLTALANKAITKASGFVLVGMLGLSLTACATAPAPAGIEAIHQATRARITYQYYHARDWRYVAPATTGTGNCAVFAFTNFVDATQAGYTPTLRTCHTAKGMAHAYTQVGSWALDNRFAWAIPMAEQDCK